MKRSMWFCMVFVCLSITGIPSRVFAVSYSVVEEQRDEKVSKGIMKAGDPVCLFQSGTADVRKAIGINDILIVYRENSKHELREIGKIRVRSFSGDDYLKGEVIEGEIQANDIAKRGNVASLVISPADKCK